MGVAIVFNWAAWSPLFPELVNSPPAHYPITQAQATALFNEATVYHDNTGCGPPTLVNVQTAMLYKLTAHLAALFQRRQRDAEMMFAVGRVASGGQGSISTTLQNEHPAGDVQWFQTTQYGSDYWAMGAPYRGFRYRHPRPRDFNPPFTPPVYGL